MAVSELSIAAVVSIANSVLTIIKTLRREPTDADIERIRVQILEEPETAAVMGISPEEGAKVVLAVGRLARDDKAFIDRITARCLEPWRKVRDDYTRGETAVEEQFQKTRRCVCLNIAIARRMTKGAFPSDDFRTLYDEFECAFLGS